MFLTCPLSTPPSPSPSPFRGLCQAELPADLDQGQDDRLQWR